MCASVCVRVCCVYNFGDCTLNKVKRSHPIDSTSICSQNVSEISTESVEE